MASGNNYTYYAKRKGKPLEDFDDSSDSEQEDLQEILDSRNPQNKQKTNNNINPLTKNSNTAIQQRNAISDSAFNDDNNNYFLHFVNFVNNIDLQYNSKFAKFQKGSNSIPSGSGQNSGDNNANIYPSCSKVDSNYYNSKMSAKKSENINHSVKSSTINIDNNESMFASCSKVDFNEYISRNDSYPTTKKCENAVKNIERSINGGNNTSMLASCSKVDSNYFISKNDSFKTTIKREKVVKNIDDISEISNQTTNNNTPSINMDSNFDEENNNSNATLEINGESESDRYKRYYKRMRRILKYLIYEREGYINQLKELEKQINQILSVNRILLQKLIYYMKNETVFHNEGNKKVARKRSMDEIWEYLKKEIPVTAGVVLEKVPVSKIDLLSDDILSSDEEEPTKCGPKVNQNPINQSEKLVLPAQYQPKNLQNASKQPEKQKYSSLNPNRTSVQNNSHNSFPFNKKLSKNISPSPSNGNIRHNSSPFNKELSNNICPSSNGNHKVQTTENSLLKKVLLSKEISTPYKLKLKPAETQIREENPEKQISQFVIPLIIPNRENKEATKYKSNVIQGHSSTSLDTNLRSTAEITDWNLTLPENIFANSSEQGTFGPATIVPEENIELVPTTSKNYNSKAVLYKSIISPRAESNKKIETTTKGPSRTQTTCYNSQPAPKRSKLTEKACMEARIVDIPGRVRTIPPFKKEEKKNSPNKNAASTSGVKLLPPLKGKPLPSLFNAPQPSSGVRVLLPKYSTVDGSVSTGKPMPSDLKKQLSAKEANRKQASKRKPIRRRKSKRSPKKEEKQCQKDSTSSAIDFETLLDDQILSQFFEHSPLTTGEVENHFELKYLENVKKANPNLKKLPETVLKKTFDEPEPENTSDNILGNEIKLDDLLTPELEEKLFTEDGILEVLSNEEVNLDLEDIISDDFLNSADADTVN